MLNVSLEDKYLIRKGRIFVNGTQVLVKLPLIQKALDKKRNLNTSGFISGYRGSPLGNYDRALWQANNHLVENDIKFSPGLNEDLAATAVWGTQQPNLISDSINDGVFSIWYGKGPGVDRSGDAFKHANSAGTNKNGGVLALLGDDHTAKSSTLAHQSEFAMLDAQIPILNPSNIYDLLEYGLFGLELSRFSGLWVSMKCITSIIDSTASIQVDEESFNFIKPDMAIWKFTESIINNKAIEVYNRGNLSRDFTYIDDIIDGVQKAIKLSKIKKFSKHRIYNLGNNAPVVLNTMIKLLEETIGKKARKQLVSMQPGDVKKTFADIEKSKRELNFQPKTSLRQGLLKFVNWYKEYYKI